jgi:cytokinin dehydrogenase
MTSRITRRDFGLALVGSAAASGSQTPVDTGAFLRNNASSLPPGLTFDEIALTDAADDFGHILHRKPAAVFEPGSTDALAKLMRFAKRHGVKVGMSGNGHSCYGQAFVENGIHVHARGLRSIHRVLDDRVEVDAGVTWSQLVEATIAIERTPPVLTEFLDLSVGGTLSVGGIGGASHRLGAQIDHVLALDVLTADGKLTSCSPERNRSLFLSTLGGFGQCALIMRATIRLVRAPARVTMQDLVYRDLSTYLADASLSVREGRFDHQLGFVSMPSGAFRLQAGVFHFEGAPETDLAGRTAGLRFSEALPQTDLTYREYLKNQRPAILTRGAASRQPPTGWYVPHATLYLFLPSTETENFITSVLAKPSEYEGLPPSGIIGLFPVNTRSFRCPLLQIPRASDEAFVFYLLRNARPGDDTQLQRMVSTNRALYERARARGGKVYPVSALPMSDGDWRDHFGNDTWSFFSEAKRRFDGTHILTPGPRIFS